MRTYTALRSWWDWSQASGAVTGGSHCCVLLHGWHVRTGGGCEQPREDCKLVTAQGSKFVRGLVQAIKVEHRCFVQQ